VNPYPELEITDEERRRAREIKTMSLEQNPYALTILAFVFAMKFNLPAEPDKVWQRIEHAALEE
jgi:hypothetical protein